MRIHFDMELRDHLLGAFIMAWATPQFHAMFALLPLAIVGFEWNRRLWAGPASVPLLLAIAAYVLTWLGTFLLYVVYLYATKTRSLTGCSAECKDDGLLLETPDVKAEFYWRGISRVLMSFGYVFIYINPRIGGIPIPARAFGSSGERALFFESVKRKLAAA